MKLHFRELGNGPELVILHGLFGSGDNWQSVARQVADEGFRVLLVDLRNHGQSPHSDDFSIDILAADVTELIKDHLTAPATVLGHSLGGKTAMKLTFDKPGLVKGLMIVDIAMRSYPVHQRELINIMRQLDFDTIKTRGEAEQQLGEKISDTGVRQFLAKNIYWQNPDRLNWRFNLQAIDRNLEEVGSAVYPPNPVEVPSRFIRGALSEYINAKDEQEILEKFTSVKILTAPEAGHWVHAENPAWMRVKIIEFLRELNDQ
jgi:esterase